MSLYNMLNGVNPIAPILLGALGIEEKDIPRFRDISIVDNKIQIYTRTGGGNRLYYESEECCRENYPQDFKDDEPPCAPWNDDLRALPGFIEDKDEDYDSTYAEFYFDIPEELSPYLDKLKALSGDEKPHEKMKSLIEQMDSNDSTNPRVVHALKVGSEILKPIIEKLNSK